MIYIKDETVFSYILFAWSRYPYSDILHQSKSLVFIIKLWLILVDVQRCLLMCEWGSQFISFLEFPLVIVFLMLNFYVFQHVVWITGLLKWDVVLLFWNIRLIFFIHWLNLSQWSKFLSIIIFQDRYRYCFIKCDIICIFLPKKRL